MTDVKINTQESHKIAGRHLQRNLNYHRMKVMYSVQALNTKSKASLSPAMAAECHRHANQWGRSNRGGAMGGRRGRRRGQILECKVNR